MKKLIKNTKIRNILIILGLFLVSSCLSRIEKQGYMFELSDYEFLEESVTTHDKAFQIMGSPSFTSYLGDSEIWIYYSQDVRKLLFFKPKIVKRQILTLEFDKDNVLKVMREYDLDDQTSLAMVSAYTKVKSKKEGFFKSLFGNVGRVTPQ